MCDFVVARVTENSLHARPSVISRTFFSRFVFCFLKLTHTHCLLILVGWGAGNCLTLKPAQECESETVCLEEQKNGCWRCTWLTVKRVWKLAIILCSTAMTAVLSSALAELCTLNSLSELFCLWRRLGPKMVARFRDVILFPVTCLFIFFFWEGHRKCCFVICLFTKQ